MAFKPFKILKGLLIKEENTNTPKQIEITPGGTSNTKTTILSSQTTDKTLTLPNATDTLMGKATTDVMTNKTFDADGTGNSISNIENADIKAAAGIVYSKLNLTNGIVDADINTTAAVTLTKLAAVTANKALQSDASGFIQASTVQSTELAHLSGVTSAIQIQINAKANQTLNNLTTVAFNTTLNPDSHNVRSIGASTLKINTIWVGSAVKSDSYDIVDGTSNNATIKGSLTYTTSAPDTIALNSALMNAAGGRVGVMSQDDAVNGNGPTGDVFVGSGNKTAGSGNSGSIKLRTGTSFGGTRGKILLEDGSLAGASTGYVWTLQNSSTGEGSWSASSGGGSSSLITNGTADNTSSSIFVPYQDSSGTRPADGNGGATTGITTSISSTTPLVGTKSFLLTKDAANRQGGGWAVPFTVDPAYRAKSLKISMDYIVNTGTFVTGSQSTDSDVIVYIYDVTNSQLIEPSNIKFLSNSSSLSDKVEATFQTSSTGSSYRLIFHIATTSASAYELKADNVVVAPQTYVFGSPVTDWQPVTMTGSFTTNTSYAARRRRIGDSYQYNVKVSFTGTPNSTTMTVNLPSGDVIDTTKLASGSNTNFESSIEGMVNFSEGSAYLGKVLLSTTTAVIIGYYDANANGGFVTQSAPTAIVNGYSISFDFTVPIVGLSSSVQMSDSADTRLQSARLTMSANQSVANGGFVKVAFDTVAEDTHGYWDAALYRYVMRSFGKLSLSGAISYAASGTGSRYAAYRVNGTTDYYFFQTSAPVSDAAVIPIAAETPLLKAGDYIEIFSGQNSGASLNIASSLTTLFISKIQGPSAIAASEKVKSIYTQNSGQTFANNTATTIIHNTKVYDSHNAYNTSTGIWTQPRVGTGNVGGNYALSIGATTSTLTLEVYKNGTQWSRYLITVNNVANTYSLPVPNIPISGIAGDQWSLVITQNTGGTRTASTNAPDNIVSFQLD